MIGNKVVTFMKKKYDAMTLLFNTKVDKVGAHVSDVLESDGSCVFEEDGFTRSLAGVSWDARMWTKHKYKKNFRVSFTPAVTGSISNAKIILGFSTVQNPTTYSDMEFSFYLYEDQIYRWNPNNAVIGTGYDFLGGDTVDIEKIGDTISIYVSGRRVLSEATGNVFSDGFYFMFYPYRAEAMVRSLDISFPIVGVNKTHYDVFSTSINIGTTTKVLCVFREMTITPGKAVDISIFVPARADTTTSWGGLYVNVLMSVNGGDWLNLGNGGYDGAVMHYSAKSIATSIARYQLDIPNNLDLPTKESYKVQFKVIGKAYSGTAKINGSHDINRTANDLGQGTALPWASAQNFTKIIVKEYDI